MTGLGQADLGLPQVVGTIHSVGALKRALRLKVGDVDLLEIRVDGFMDEPEKLLEAVPDLPAPLLLTVRHPKEGGMAEMTLAERRKWFRQFLPLVQWMDVEVQSLGGLEEEIAHAEKMGVQLVVSDHYFKKMPTLARMRDRERKARKAGAEVFKLAARANDAKDLERLLVFLNEGKAQGLAVMGMGEMGKVSRLLLGRCGSVLNYGYLDTPQVSGQWEACTLKKRLFELFDEGSR